MPNSVLKHEKVRFRRGEIRCLDTYASAAAGHVQSAHGRLARRAGRVLGLAAAGAAGLLLLAVAALYGVSQSGYGAARLEAAAADALRNFGEEGLVTRFERVAVSLDGTSLLKLVIGQAQAISPQDGSVVAAGEVSFGLRLLPLLRGRIALRQVTLSQARIDLGALAAARGQQAPPFVDAAWLREPVDLDAANAAIFEWARALHRQIARAGVNEIRLRDVSLAFGAGEGAVVQVGEAALSRVQAGRASLTAEASWQGRTLTLQTALRHDAQSDLVTDLEIALSSDAGVPAQDARLGALEATISGRESAAGRGALRLAATLRDVAVELSGRSTADLSIRAESVSGTDKLEINELRVASGRSRFAFHGAIGAVPEDEAARAPGAYRFELVSDGSVLAPDASPEPPLRALARIAGHMGVDDEGFSLDAGEIRLRTDQGELWGHLAAIWPFDGTPGLDLAFTVADMPVGQVKQVWPWFAAGGARRWVMANAYGGRVTQGEVQMTVPPRRLGNGVPLDADELSGRFSIEGTRFDVAGTIPPVRDGRGTVAFDGTDVHIYLESGTVYMPSGRTVAASRGSLDILNASRARPLIGRLSIGVEGDAAAIMELAGYDPVDVGRFVDLAADELSGQASGTVQADIPLQPGVAAESLDWHISLAYRDLAIARLFEGQRVTAANGTIEVDPRAAVIEAQAHLNGVPAQIRLVEPLRASEAVARARNVTLQFDDAARRALAPDLDTILSGPAAVEVTAQAEGQRIVADLARSHISLPWIGWNKGSGIPAQASFFMAQDGDRAQLDDFRLSGESFAVSGALSLFGGAVERARFPSVRMNPGDDFSVDIRREGGTYAVTVRGQRADARSVVKMFTENIQHDRFGAEAANAAPVRVDLKLDTLTGFHGEILSNVQLTYQAGPGGTHAMAVTATTRNGGSVSFGDMPRGGARHVELQSSDAGAVLRFLDIYERMEGGRIGMALSGPAGGPLSGYADARDFWLVNEQRLGSLVSTPADPRGRSLNQAVRGDLDASRVQFERAASRIEKGAGYLSLEHGILRGPLLGMSFQGMLYDAHGNMAMTGTLMPAYGLNRLFADIPIIGQILGNGRDRGLIGLTFRLAGRADDPQLQINPLSVIAPGVFRSVFEFR